MKFRKSGYQRAAQAYELRNWDYKAVPVLIGSALTHSLASPWRGLDPRVHPLRKSVFCKKKMDCRVKPGNDEGETVRTILHPFEWEPL